ncbi:MAG: NADP(H)-dependent aldo-keto reductase [Rhodospirillaceae bacterium]|nr:NADP(H)-dependent aldo-keto reductase [Rhodospirillaceae bacterium]|tara:strand:+ start:8067 stop:9110 length:1044 start_codon:yes stop_codon:yes gene_type:complete
MQYRRLGRTEIDVSLLCIGSMNWGSNNTEAEGHAQMDKAVDHGVNFIDTAEMYAVPPSEETYGNSERVIGTWMKARGNRDKVIIASKVAGPDERLTYVRDGHPRLNTHHIDQAIDASLERLQTDYVDLYQLHWPDRDTNTFGQLGYQHVEDADETPLEETLAALGDLVKAGKVRHIGVSNETPWGTMRLLHLADTMGLPRIVTNQNPYSLLNRSFEAGCAEIAMREQVGLLAYAPMAAGALSGKYLGGARPEGARMTRYPTNRRYLGPPNAEAATRAYADLAREHGLEPGQMALAFVNRQPFLTSNIFGASSMEQLDAALKSDEVTLSEDVLSALEDIHKRYTYPCP